MATGERAGYGDGLVASSARLRRAREATARAAWNGIMSKTIVSSAVLSGGTAGSGADGQRGNDVSARV